MTRRSATIVGVAALATLLVGLLGPGGASAATSESARSARSADSAGPAESRTGSPWGAQEVREAQNRALVRHVLARLDAGDVGVIERTHRTDFRYHRPGVPAGLEPIKGFWSAMLATYPDLSLTIEDIAADGDKVIARITFRGTPRGETSQLTMATADVWRVQHRRLAEHWDVVEDPQGMLRRVGTP